MPRMSFISCSCSTACEHPAARTPQNSSQLGYWRAAGSPPLTIFAFRCVAFCFGLMLVAGRGSTSTRPAELDDRVMQDVGLGGEVELRMRCDVDVVAMDGPLMPCTFWFPQNSSRLM